MEAPELDDWAELAALRLWAVFLDLNASRSYTMSGPAGLSYAELAAFCHLRGDAFEQWQLDAIRALDREFLASANEREG